MLDVGQAGNTEAHTPSSPVFVFGVCACVLCVYLGYHPLQTPDSVRRQQEGDGGVDGGSAQRPEQTEL